LGNQRIAVTIGCIGRSSGFRGHGIGALWPTDDPASARSSIGGMDEPLNEALETIAPELDEGIDPLMVALKEDGSLEDAWERMLGEILDEA
jgi:hypothetical protein